MMRHRAPQCPAIRRADERQPDWSVQRCTLREGHQGGHDYTQRVSPAVTQSNGHWWQLDEHQRAYLYRALVAAGGVALVLGLVTDSQLTALVGLAGALLGNGVAARHTSTKRPRR